MFGNDISFRIEHELEREIERKCLILNLDCNDNVAVQTFAHDVLGHLEPYGKAAAGNMQARVKIELYGMAMLMHKNNTANFGPGYISQLDALSAYAPAWVHIARAIWNELERRGVVSDEKKEQE